MRGLAISVLAVVLSSTACLGSSAPGTSGPTLTELTAGPDAISGTLTGRVMLIGGPCVCPGPLENGTFELRAGGRIVAVVRTDRRGRFEIGVPAGRYRLATGRRMFYPLRPRSVRIVADRTTSVTMRFGII